MKDESGRQSTVEYSNEGMENYNGTSAYCTDGGPRQLCCNTCVTPLSHPYNTHVTSQ